MQPVLLDATRLLVLPNAAVVLPAVNRLQVDEQLVLPDATHLQAEPKLVLPGETHSTVDVELKGSARSLEAGQCLAVHRSLADA